MLSIIIDADGPPLALSATLSPLVRGVVEGIVGSAMLVVPKETDELTTIADAAGCRLLASSTFGEGFARAITYTNGSGVLVLSAGVQVGPEFWPVLADQLPVIGQVPAVTQLIKASIFQRISGFRGQVSRDQALLLPPALAREIGLEKADPFTRRYGNALITLPAQARRIALSPRL
ncbi:MAG: hypothetical protein LCH39_10345 [Proteobacteria bacterium]|nr:hypothetical protein [Pseudomonadota bacterium]